MLRSFPFACGLLAWASTTAVAQTSSIATVAPAETDDAAAAATPAGHPVYFVADEMPAFPGGTPALLRFLSRQLQYPAAALDRGLSGKVHVTFIVDPEGRLHDPRVVRGLGAGLDEEALRLVRLMPWWIPGRIQGRAVWTSVTMPIGFRML